MNSTPQTQTPSFQDVIRHPVPAISIVDAGAMLEGRERYHELVAMGLATVTGFEPNPEQFAKLQQRQGPYRYLPVFLGNGRSAKFRITRYPGCSSLLEPDPTVIDLFQTIGCADENGNFHVQRTTKVKTTKLDDIGREIKVDFLKLDVQGSELDILKNGIRKLSDTVIIESEVEFVPLYKKQPLFGDIQTFLYKRGFVLHKLLDVAGRPFRPFSPPNPLLPMSQLLWADAIFVRDFARLDAYADEGLLRAAAILDVVYGSYDLAALLLKEFDRRKSTRLHGSYLESLKGRELVFRAITIRDHTDLP